MGNIAKRLNIRLSGKCSCNCDHCTMRDLPPVKDLPFDVAVRIAGEQYAAGCREIVIMREASQWADLPEFISVLRDIGYSLIQMQTNGRIFSERDSAEKMVGCGLTHVEVNVFAARKASGDAVMRVPGAQLQVLSGIRNELELGIGVLVVVPVLKSNLGELNMLVRLLASLQVSNIQFNFPRPVFSEDRWRLDNLPRLAEASVAAEAAMRLAALLGMSVSSEAFPFCHLAPQFRRGPDSDEDFSRHVIVDLHISHADAGVQRRQGRPYAEICQACAVKSACPVTWAAYQDLFGTSELWALKSAEEELRR